MKTDIFASCVVAVAIGAVLHGQAAAAAAGHASAVAAADRCRGRRSRGTGGPPKLAIAPFIALSQDAETVAAAKTIADVLYDDIDYEREYYMIGKDAIATVPKPTSLDNVPI